MANRRKLKAVAIFIAATLACVGAFSYFQKRPSSAHQPITKVRITLSDEQAGEMYASHEKEIKPYLEAPCVGSSDLNTCLSETAFAELEKLPRTNDVDGWVINTVVYYISRHSDKEVQRRALDYVSSFSAQAVSDDNAKELSLNKMVLNYALGSDEEADRILDTFKNYKDIFRFGSVPQHRALDIVVDIGRVDKARQIFEHTSHWKMQVIRRMHEQLTWVSPVLRLIDLYLQKDQPEDALATAVLLKNSSYYEAGEFEEGYVKVAKYYASKGGEYAAKHEEMCERLASEGIGEASSQAGSEASEVLGLSKFIYKDLYEKVSAGNCAKKMKQVAKIILEQKSGVKLDATNPLQAGAYWDWAESDADFGDNLIDLLYGPEKVFELIEKSTASDRYKINRYYARSVTYHESGDKISEDLAVTKMLEIYDQKFRSGKLDNIKLGIATGAIYTSLKRAGRDAQAREILSSVTTDDLKTISPYSVKQFYDRCLNFKDGNLCDRIKPYIEKSLNKYTPIYESLEKGDEKKAFDLITQADANTKATISTDYVRNFNSKKNKSYSFYKMVWPTYMETCLKMELRYTLVPNAVLHCIIPRPSN